jgi:trehalose 6-phosphate phosphatase
MQHLLTRAGEFALVELLRQHPLMAFDFDGTIAPIVTRPDEARIPEAVARRMAALARQLPVAIVTGRSVADVRGRLGFEPRFVVGNHGSEDPQAGADTSTLAGALDPFRATLQSAGSDLADSGVTVEDKGLSIALHFRVARDPGRAQALIARLLQTAHPGMRIFAGKKVVNVAPASAADKADSVLALVRRCGAAAAFFAGDDVNDEPVFEAAPAHWLTLRVGRNGPASKARFWIDGPQAMPMLLDRVLGLCAALPGRPS